MLNIAANADIDYIRKGLVKRLRIGSAIWGTYFVLKNGKEKRIAVFLPATAEYSRRLATGVHEYCNQHLGLLWRDFWFAPEMGFVDSTRGEPPWIPWKPHGLIAHAGRPEVDIHWLKAGVEHVVTTTSDCSTDMMPVVHVDRSSIARLAVKHFLELGRSNFACIGLQQYRAGLIRQYFEEELARQRHTLTQLRPLERIRATDRITSRTPPPRKDTELLDFLRDAHQAAGDPWLPPTPYRARAGLRRLLQPSALYRARRRGRAGPGQYDSWPSRQIPSPIQGTSIRRARKSALQATDPLLHRLLQGEPAARRGRF